MREPPYGPCRFLHQPLITHIRMSQYPLPPVSTLSAALDSVPIAPELMGIEGLPLPLKRRGSDTSPYTYQRDNRWAYPPNEWDEQRQELGTDISYKIEPDITSAHNPKKRKRRAKSPEDDIENGEREHEYEHPSGDFKLGPVFVHPPKGAAQACMRCHRIKRKCDSARPRCAGCSKADVACVFELSASTST